MGQDRFCYRRSQLGLERLLQNQQTRILWDTDKQKYQFLLIFPVFSCYIGNVLLNFFEDNAQLRGRRRAQFAVKVPS